MIRGCQKMSIELHPCSSLRRRSCCCCCSMASRRPAGLSGSKPAGSIGFLRSNPAPGPIPGPGRIPGPGPGPKPPGPGPPCGNCWSGMKGGPLPKSVSNRGRGRGRSAVGCGPWKLFLLSRKRSSVGGPPGNCRGPGSSCLPPRNGPAGPMPSGPPKKGSLNGGLPGPPLNGPDWSSGLSLNDPG